MRGRDLLSISDLSREEIFMLYELTSKLKGTPFEDSQKILAGKSVAMLFEKPSLRTRVTFELGVYQLGGYALFLEQQNVRLGEREAICDVARNLARWVDGIIARVFAHETLLQLAEYADIPVINALSDLEHPCQALADFYTLLEKRGSFEGLSIAYVGDGNNVCHSLLLLAGKIGVNMRVASPEGYEPREEIVKRALNEAEKTGANIQILNDPHKAVEGVDAIYTDVWASMGQEEEREIRAKIFKPYQVNEELVKLARSDAYIMHCLPAHRGEEITDEVIDSPQSIVLDQAENRLHVQKALMAWILGGWEG